MATFQLEWRHQLVGSAIGWCPHEPALKRPCEVVSMLGRDPGCPRFPGGELSRKTKWENTKWENKVKEGVL